MLPQIVNGIGLPAVIHNAKELLTRRLVRNSSPSILLLPLCLYPIINKICRRIREDYRLFLSLGPGGTPSTPIGYLKVSILKLFIANNDVYSPPRHDPVTDKPEPYFTSILDIPHRQGARPVVAGIAPQRQVSHRGDNAQIAGLQIYMRSLAAANSKVLETGRSCFEKQSLALFLKHRSSAQGIRNERRVPPNINANFSDLDAALASHEGRPLNATCGLPPEIVHMHGSEGSMHLTLHPEDAAVVIQRGWGERHPLAGAGGLLRDIFSGKGFRTLFKEGPSEGWLPKGFVMVYAPRNEEEREVVGKIVRAGAWWVGGIKLNEQSGF